jgi:anti-anti-sigma factor
MALRIDITEENDVIILKIIGKVDSFTHPELNNSFDLVMKKGKKNILLIMRDMNYIDSIGIGSIIRFAKWVAKIGGTLKIAEMQSNIRQVFRLLSYDQILSIYDSASEAIMSFREDYHPSDQSI